MYIGRNAEYSLSRLRLFVLSSVVWRWGFVFFGDKRAGEQKWLQDGGARALLFGPST